MDTTKWKSVLLPKSVYDDIKALAKKERRTISGQLRIVFEVYLLVVKHGLMKELEGVVEEECKSA